MVIAKSEGSEISLEGNRVTNIAGNEGGLFMEQTIIVLDKVDPNKCRLLPEEIFRLVMILNPFRDEDQVTD